MVSLLIQPQLNTSTESFCFFFFFVCFEFGGHYLELETLCEHNNNKAAWHKNA